VASHAAAAWPSASFAGLVAVALLANAPCAQPLAAPTTEVVEFYSPAQDHFFMTGDPEEISGLDSGIHPGWRRTGLGFQAYTSSAPGSSPVCRFYIPPVSGDSHFYSASPAECAQTQLRFPGFTFESADVFRVGLPNIATGACRSDEIPVYRLWNGRADTNHRYTTDHAVWQAMRAQGWTGEGFGNSQVIMCSPSGTTIDAVDLSIAGRAAIKARAGGGVLAVLEERLISIFETGPDRILALVGSDGRSARAYAPPAGWSLADFAVHPSGEISLVLTTQKDVRVLRLDRAGQTRSDETFADSSSPNDPFLSFGTLLKDDNALQPILMHDAARLAPLGEDLALVLRTGRNAVVAYRLGLDANAGYQRTWRTLVEPGSSLDGVFLESGSFDTFGQLQNHVEVRVDVNDTGTLAIAVVESPFRSFVFEAHAAYFMEPVVAQAGVLLTRLTAAEGRRLGSTVIDTRQISELYGLRATPDGFALVGRVRTHVLPDGSGWDAFFARIAADGSVISYNVVDIDRGDALFDVVTSSSSGYIALGTTGYVQNPGGASISEDAQPLLLLLDATGNIASRIDLLDGPRQDQLRTIDSFAARWIIGGMRNGPGTHSGDADPRLITADGFIVEPTGLSTQ
jgi:hypothetical protein